MKVLPSLVCAFACSGPFAFAGGLPYASGYNVFTFGNFQSQNIDSGGAIAIGGNLALSGYNIAQNPMIPSSYASSVYSMIVGGQFSGTTSVASGKAYVGSKASGSNIYLNGSGSPTLTVGGTSPIDFSAAQSALTSESTLLSQQISNATVQASGNNLTINTGSTVGTYYVTMTAAQLAIATALNITFATGSTLVINVSGTSSSIPNIGMTVNGGSVTGDATTSAARNLLFNFYQANSLVFNGSLIGSVLAPQATVTAPANLQLDGQLVANKYIGKGTVSNPGGDIEFHNFQFNGNIPSSIPEPGTWLLSGAGIAALGWMKRRRRLR